MSSLPQCPDSHSHCSVLFLTLGGKLATSRLVIKMFVFLFALRRSKRISGRMCGQDTGNEGTCVQGKREGEITLIQSSVSLWHLIKMHTVLSSISKRFCVTLPIFWSIKSHLFKIPLGVTGSQALKNDICWVCAREAKKKKSVNLGSTKFNKFNNFIFYQPNYTLLSHILISES